MRRRWRFAAAAEHLPDTPPLMQYFTPEVARQLMDLAAWNWTSVLPQAMRVWLAFVCIIVGLQKALTLFFVWLIAAVAPAAPAGAIAIFMGAGAVREALRKAFAPLH